MGRKNHPDIVGEVIELEDGHVTINFSLRKILELHLRTIGIGKKVRVEIVKFYKKRSNKQNGYLWAVVYPTIILYIREQTGQKFEAEDLHEKYKRQFLGYEVCKIMPELTRAKSSSDLTTVSFNEELVELIVIEWANNGLYIPPPDPKWREQNNG